MTELLKTPLGRFRLLALVEGVSFLVILFVTMPLKYGFDKPEPNQFFGMLHGVLFIAYVFMAIRVTVTEDWSLKKLGLALLASIVPFGTFWADKKLFRA